MSRRGVRRRVFLRIIFRRCRELIDWADLSDVWSGFLLDLALCKIVDRVSGEYSQVILYLSVVLAWASAVSQWNRVISNCCCDLWKFTPYPKNIN